MQPEDLRQPPPQQTRSPITRWERGHLARIRQKMKKEKIVNHIRLILSCATGSIMAIVLFSFMKETMVIPLEIALAISIAIESRRKYLVTIFVTAVFIAYLLILSVPNESFSSLMLSVVAPHAFIAAVFCLVFWAYDRDVTNEYTSKTTYDIIIA